MSEITIRQPNFEFDEELALMPDTQDAMYSAFSCSVTILSPHIERYLIRVMRSCLSEIKDEKLQALVKAFCGQEASHFKNHDRLNEILRAKMSEAGRQKLQKAEAQLDADYARFFKEKDLLFNLAYAEGFESATCAMSLWAFEHNTLANSQKAWKDIIEWHLAEEIEHRSVAYDVYKYFGGSYRHRLIWGSYGQWHLYKYLQRFGRIFLSEFPERVQTRHVLKQRGKPLLWQLLKTLSPSYSPHNVAVPKGLKGLLTQYSS
ncbi:MAG: metal-dependent hydrolase [Cellvibrionaceae bacterium]|nr:metal-dependent hydrolase [Cellvibrionaceae bacterium]